VRFSMYGKCFSSLKRDMIFVAFGCRAAHQLKTFLAYLT
jgi:hypothetical protein